MTWEQTARCPLCGVEHDSITGMNFAGKPKDGDVTVCIDCAEPLWLDKTAEGGLRAPTPAERAELLGVDLVAFIRKQLSEVER